MTCSTAGLREFSLDKTLTIYILSGFEREPGAAMRVHVADLKDKTLVLSAEEQVADYPGLLSLVDAGECEFLKPLYLSFSVAREFDHIRVAGRVETAVRMSCSRCLNQFENEITSTFTIFYSKAAGMPMDEEVELAEEDLISATYDGDEIDLSPEVAEQVIMEIPFKPLCKEDCLGLCSKCGANLNETSCNCDRSDSSFKFAALKGLKIEK